MLGCITFTGSQRLPDYLFYVDIFQIHAHLAGLYFFAVQNVVDQPNQAFAVVLGNVY